MQNNRNGSASHARHVQSTQARSASRYARDDSRSTVLLLAALCLLLPPLGTLFIWRSNRIGSAIRAAFSGLALISMSCIFCFILRPDDSSGAIYPTPVVPSQVGYGVPAAESQTAVPEPDSAVPASPDAVAPSDASGSGGQSADEPGALTPETTVYAVTNNASSYHLYEVCETQTNNRALTLQQALDEGLAPCEKCVGAVG